MRNTEKYLPIVLCLLVPGMSFLNQNLISERIPWEYAIPQYLITSVYLFILWHSNAFGARNKDSSVSKRLSYPVFLLLINLAVFSCFMGMNVLLHSVIWEKFQQVPAWLALFRLAIAATVFILIQRTLEAIRQRETFRVQNLSLQAENLKSQLEAMKQQINPHFLFNSLNSLLDLIEEDQVKATDFVRSFSNLYRVVLQSSQKDFILLEDELKFLEDYWGLLKIRFHNALNLHVKIPDSIMQHWVPPLALQLLVENAVKHNLATPKEPLDINIIGKGDELVISNSINPKEYEVKGEGVGLSNLQKRFTLLLEPISYGPVDGSFVIRLPLKSA